MAGPKGRSSASSGSAARPPRRSAQAPLPRRVVNMHEAKTHLSRLVDQAAKGEPFIIARAGKPLVKVVPLETHEARPKSRLGFMAGQLKIPDDFDTMGQEEIIRLFEGEE